jgi:tetratricopeptide (TPR) repeat protein
MQKLRLILLFVFLFFCRTYVHAQTAGYEKDHIADSLRQVLLIQKPDTSKLRTCYKLVQQLCDKDGNAALEYARKMELLADSLGTKKWKARALNGYGNIYLNRAQYQNSLFSFLQALRIYELLNDTGAMGAICNGIGNVYERLNKPEVCRQYYTKAAEYYKTAALFSGLGQVHANIAGIFITEKKYKEALMHYDSALAINMHYNDSYGICIVSASKGNAYFLMNEMPKAKEYCLKAIKGNCNPHICAAAEESLGNIYTHEKDWELALEHFKKAEQLALSAGIDYILPGIYKGISDVLKKQKKFKEALSYYEHYHTQKESDLGLDKMRKIEELQLAYELEKKDREIETLDNAKTVAELRSGKDRLYRNSFIIAFILAVVISLAFIRNAYLKQKVNRILEENNDSLNEKNIQIEFQKHEIEKINAELDKYNKEVVKENIIAKYEILKGKTNPHFLFNSLTSLSALVIRDKASALEFIEHFSELYRMILEMGDNRLISLKQEMELVKNYLYLEKTRFRNNLIIHINVDERLMELLLPSFAIQICVENSLKHNTVSEAQKLTISIVNEDHKIIIKNNLQIKNTGVVSTSTGQKNIMERYRLITHQEPVFEKTETEYLVKLPLLSKEERLEL